MWQCSVKQFYNQTSDADTYLEMLDQGRLQKYDDIIKSVSSGSKWTDSTAIEFPTLPPSTKKPVFVNPSEVPAWSGTKCALFKHGTDVQFTDIQQGRPSGGGWFLQALSAVVALGRVQELVKRFDEDRGVYEFHFYRWQPGSGFQPICVCVDSRVPILKGEDKVPAFCYSSKPGDLWPSLIEKAFAKAVQIKSKDKTKGYVAMLGGFPCIGICHMLGGGMGINKIVPPCPAEALACELENRVNSGQVVTLGWADEGEGFVQLPGDDTKYNKGVKGLVAGRPYHLLRVVRAAMADGAPVVVMEFRSPFQLKARNPEVEWQGDWSDNSTLWNYNASVKSKCAFAKGDGTIFWMSSTDVAENALVYHYSQPLPPPDRYTYDGVTTLPTEEDSDSEGSDVEASKWPSSFFYPTEDEPYFTFWDQEHFQSFEDVANSVRDGQKWVDDKNPTVPKDPATNQTPVFVSPSEVPDWKKVTAEFRKTEKDADVALHCADIMPGRLGDSSMSNALISLARDGRLAESICRFDDKKGIYQFNLYRYVPKEGWKAVQVCVDNRVPVVKDKDKVPCYSHSRRPGELWPTLLEKAFAKCIKKRESGDTGYEAMEGCPVSVLLCHLYGGSACIMRPPPDVSDLDLRNECFRRLRNGEFVTITFTQLRGAGEVEGVREGSQVGKAAYGLVSSLEYPVHDLHCIPAKEQIFLLEFRSPYGIRTQGAQLFSGDWSKDSAIWDQHATAKTEVKFPSEYDGRFYMDVNDVASTMKALSSCAPPPARQIPIPKSGQENNYNIFQPGSSINITDILEKLTTPREDGESSPAPVRRRLSVNSPHGSQRKLKKRSSKRRADGTSSGSETYTSSSGSEMESPDQSPKASPKGSPQSSFTFGATAPMSPPHAASSPPLGAIPVLTTGMVIPPPLSMDLQKKKEAEEEENKRRQQKEQQERDAAAKKRQEEEAAAAERQRKQREADEAEQRRKKQQEDEERHKRELREKEEAAKRKQEQLQREEEERQRRRREEEEARRRKQQQEEEDERRRRAKAEEEAAARRKRQEEEDARRRRQQDDENRRRREQEEETRRRRLEDEERQRQEYDRKIRQQREENERATAAAARAREEEELVRQQERARQQGMMDERAQEANRLRNEREAARRAKAEEAERQRRQQEYDELSKLSSRINQTELESSRLSQTATSALMEKQNVVRTIQAQRTDRARLTQRAVRLVNNFEEFKSTAECEVNSFQMTPYFPFSRSPSRQKTAAVGSSGSLLDGPLVTRNTRQLSEYQQQATAPAPMPGIVTTHRLSMENPPAAVAAAPIYTYSQMPNGRATTGYHVPSMVTSPMQLSGGIPQPYTHQMVTTPLSVPRPVLAAPGVGTVRSRSMPLALATNTLPASPISTPQYLMQPSYLQSPHQANVHYPYYR